MNPVSKRQVNGFVANPCFPVYLTSVPMYVPLILGNLYHPKNLCHINYCAKLFFFKVWATLNLSLAIIKGNLGHDFFALSVFSQNMSHAQPIQNIIVKKCPKLLRIYGNCFVSA